jgi:bifunctional non-homologous end joining protein LigD
MARFLIHRHSAGRRHFDLRLVLDTHVRSWSLLKDPPTTPGEKRLAIERERMTAEDIDRQVIEEEAFGAGRVVVWDRGQAACMELAPGHLVLDLRGDLVRGRYELRRMSWYPGNRWLLEKSGRTDGNLS